MRVLGGYACALAALAVFACAPGPPRTPEDAVEAVKKAVAADDPRALKPLLSSASIERAGVVARALREANESQVQAVSRRFRIPPDRVRTMTVEDYLFVMMRERSGRNVLKRALGSRITVISRGERTAVVKTASGIDLLLVREGPYWKLDLTDL